MYYVLITFNFIGLCPELVHYKMANIYKPHKAKTRRLKSKKKRWNLGYNHAWWLEELWAESSYYVQTSFKCKIIMSFPLQKNFCRGGNLTDRGPTPFYSFFPISYGSTNKQRTYSRTQRTQSRWKRGVEKEQLHSVKCSIRQVAHKMV